MKNVKTLTKAELEMMKEHMNIYVSEGYTITAQKPIVGEVYHNFLENVDYCAAENDTDKVLLIGTVGESWFAPIKKVLKQYSKEDGTQLLESDITDNPIKIKRLHSYNAAIQLTEDTNIITSNEYVLHAKTGDYLVCSVKEENQKIFPDDQWGYWTINKEVFYNTNYLYCCNRGYYEKTIIKLGQIYEEYEGFQMGFIYDVLKRFFYDSKHLNKKMFCCINGYMFYSDDQITADEAYYHMTGMTIEQSKTKHKEFLEKQKQADKDFKRNLPQIINNYCIKGTKIIEEKYLKNWEKCVRYHIKGIYKGKILDCSLKIIDLLNKNIPLNIIKKEFDEDGHSGMSESICLSIIKDFCDKGKEFYNYMK